MSEARGITRRRFLSRATAGAGFGVAAPYVLTSSALGNAQKAPANSRITLGFIGVRSMGGGHLNRFRSNRRVQILASILGIVGIGSVQAAHPLPDVAAQVQHAVGAGPAGERAHRAGRPDVASLVRAIRIDIIPPRIDAPTRTLACACRSTLV